MNPRKTKANDAIDLKVMVRALWQKLPPFLWRPAHLFDRDLDAKDLDGLVGVPVDPLIVLIGSRGFYRPDPHFSSYPVCGGVPIDEPESCRLFLGGKEKEKSISLLSGSAIWQAAFFVHISTDNRYSSELPWSADL